MRLPGLVTAAVCCMLLFLSPPAVADELLEKLRASATAEIEKVETETLFKQADLSAKYLAALKGLEKKLAAQGNLDTIVRVREEAEAVEKTGEVTAHADKELADLRSKYTTAKEGMTKEANAARGKIVEAVTRGIREQEATLAKAGKVDEALALRKEGERMLLELSAGVPNSNVEFEEDPRGTASVELQDLKPINVPTDSPPLFEKPFSIKGRWLESMTLPVLKQRLSDPVTIGDRGPKKWPKIVIPKGSVWSGRDVHVDLSAASLVATKSSFENLTFFADLGSTSFFVNCAFDGCGFGKGGIWYGWDQAAKFYFENCVVAKRLAQTMNVVDHGIRAQSCVFENIELPPMSYRGREPAGLLNNKWMRFVNCRFVGCKVPSSFALLTRDCLFQDCVFIDDSKLEAGAKPIEVVLYIQPGGRWDISKLPPNVTLTRKSDAERKGAPVPTAASLRAMMGM